MDKLNFPAYTFKVKGNDTGKQIFDEIRKKYVALTPEEWVRQHIIRYLIDHKKYPAGLFAVESGTKYNRLKKRTDLVIYDREGKALVIVECKAPDICLNQKSFNQIASYNKNIRGKYLIVTNGLSHYCCEVDYLHGRHKFLEEIPEYIKL